MKNIFIILAVVFMFVILTGLLSGVDAQLSVLGTFEQGENINLLQLCANCTFNNISSVTSPNSTELISNVLMTKIGTNYNYTLLKNNTLEIGSYNVNGFGDPNGINEIWAYSFDVTKTGKVLETSESLIFILLTVAVFIFFLLSFYFAIVTPYSNEVDGQGMVIRVTKLKYVKLLFIMLSYLLFIWFLNTLIGVSENFLSLTLFAGFVGFLFQSMNSLALPFGIFIIVLSFFEVIRDANLQNNIKLLMGAMR